MKRPSVRLHRRDFLSLFRFRPATSDSSVGIRCPLRRQDGRYGDAGRETSLRFRVARPRHLRQHCSGNDRTRQLVRQLLDLALSRRGRQQTHRLLPHRYTWRDLSRTVQTLCMSARGEGEKSGVKTMWPSQISSRCLDTLLVDQSIVAFR